MLQGKWRKKVIGLFLLLSLIAPLFTATQAQAAQVTSGWRRVQSYFTNGYSGYYQPAALDLTYAPAAVAGPNGQITVFAIEASDGHLLATTYQQTAGVLSYGWSEWDREPLGVYTSSPSAVVRSDGSFQVFAEGKDQRLWTVVYGAGGWSAPQLVRSDGALLYGPSAVTSSSGAIYVFVTGLDGHLYFTTNSGGAWSAWNQDPNGVFTSAPSAVNSSSNYFQIYARGTDSHLWRASLNSGATWGGLAQINGTALLADAPAAETSIGYPTDIFIQGKGDRHLWYQQDDGSPYFTQEPTMIINSAPAALAMPNGRVEVFAIGTDYHLWQITFNEYRLIG